MKYLRNYIAEDFETIFVFFTIRLLNIEKKKEKRKISVTSHVLIILNKFYEFLLEFRYILAEHILF